MKKTFTKIASFLTVAILVCCTGNMFAQADCATALPIACGDANVLGSTVGAAPYLGGTCVTTQSTGGANWYVFTGTGDIVTLNTCHPGTSYDTKLFVWDGTGGCGALTCVTGNDDVTCTPLFRSEVQFTSNVGQTYYIQVAGFGAAEGNYEMSIACQPVVFGCTDGATPACNYDPAATTDDGSCEYTSCAGCTDATACNYDPAATLDNGTCDYSCLGCTDNTACDYNPLASTDPAINPDFADCCFDNCYTLVVGGGTFDSEVGWSIVNAIDNTIVAAGGAGTFDLCIPAACYFFDMTDSFGDGWNGATYTLSDANGVVQSGDLNTAEQGDGASTGRDALILDDPANCPSGCTDAGACNFDTGAILDDGSCEYLSCAGCTDPGATNYDPGATIDDGSCVTCAAGEAILIIDMTDSFGDGWNGGTYTVIDLATNDIYTGDLDNAQTGDGLSVGTDYLCLAPGCYTFSAGGGTFEAEMGWALSDNLGNDYGSGGAPTTNYGVDLGFTGGCDFSGCTDPVCIGYNPSATIDDGSCQCPPANNDICDAEPIDCGLSAFGSTINATDNEGLIGTTCGAATVTSPGVWYEFNAAADQQVIVSTCASIGAPDTKMFVYTSSDGTCNGTLTCVAQNDDGCPGGGFSSELAFNSVTGTNYFILVGEFGAGVGVDFQLDVACQDCTGGVPVNDDCSGALAQIDGVTFTGTTCCASGSDAPNFAAGFGTAYDVFFTFNSGDCDTFDFNVTNTGGSEVGLMIYDGACGSLVDVAGCVVTGTCAGSIEDFLTLTPNTDYYFAVFTTDPAGCGTFEFTTNCIYLGCTDPTACNYDVGANQDDGTCEWDSCGQVPDNDLCANALPLPCNAVTDGSTGGSTNTGAPNGVAGCDTAPGTGVWYNFTGTGELHTISLCGSVIDSKINLYTAADCAGPFLCAGSAGQGAAASFEECGFFDQDDASLTFISVPGENYYLYVSAEDQDGDPLTNDNGTFSIDFSCATVVNGCTNSAACNYDPAANVDDGSCDFFSCTCDLNPSGTAVQLELFDSFGDGWNGATYTLIDAATGTIVASGDIDTAAYSEDNDNFQGAEYGFDLLCLDASCYDIVLGGGSFDGEISFQISDVNGVIAAGGAGTTSFSIGGAVCGCTDPGACNFDPAADTDDGTCEFVTCAGCTDPAACNFDNTATITDNAQCCFDNCVSIVMNDSFGDGWNGATYEIFTADGVSVATGDLDNAQSGDGSSTGTDELCLADGCYYIVVGGGTFDSEVSWTLVGVTEGIVSGGAPTAAGEVFFGAGTGCVYGCDNPVACNYDATVNVSDCTQCTYDCGGCTYPDATNYDPAAGIDDGSCLFDTANPCPEDLNEDGVVNAADLLQFLGAFGTTCPN